LTFRFALGATTARTGRLVINGSAQDITFAPTGAWNAWATMDVPASLPAGPGNTIRLETNGQDLANIDEISVTVFSESP
ncbi:MAG: silent information regulator protein Sir2, partial [Verrucomicrobiae bacterium]|nr:silent information regulator protein Sir2 [Verrucomicrobiae bacterium]